MRAAPKAAGQSLAGGDVSADASCAWLPLFVFSELAKRCHFPQLDDGRPQLMMGVSNDADNGPLVLPKWRLVLPKRWQRAPSMSVRRLRLPPDPPSPRVWPRGTAARPDATHPGGAGAPRVPPGSGIRSRTCQSRNRTPKPLG